MSTIPQRIGIIGSTVILESAPGAPVLETVVAGTSSIVLTWESSFTGGSPITSYVVLRSTTSGGETVLASGLSPTSLTYTDSAVSGSTRYFYTVEAVNAIGTSPQSNELSAVLPSVPSAPVLTGAAAGSGQVSLSWTAPASGGSPLTSYTLLRGTSMGGETSYITGISPNVLNYVDTAATNGTQYFYTLEAINAVGTSAASNELSATPGSGITAPPAPTLVSALPANGSVTLHWTTNGTGGSVITSFTVLRALTSGGETTYHSGILASATSYVDNTVTDGTTYFYKVVAINAIGASLPSNEESANPTPVLPGAPVLSAVAGSGQVVLSWTAPNNGGSPLTSYSLVRTGGTTPPPTGTAGFNQPIMSAPAGPHLKGTYTQTLGTGPGQMFWQDTFQTGTLNQSYWRNTWGDVVAWSNDPSYAKGSVSVAPATSGGGLTCDNTTGGASSCVVTCEPVGAGATPLVTFPQAGWYIQLRGKMSDMTGTFFPAFWFPRGGAINSNVTQGCELDWFEGGDIPENKLGNNQSHFDYNGAQQSGFGAFRTANETWNYNIGGTGAEFGIWGMEYRPNEAILNYYVSSSPSMNYPDVLVQENGFSGRTSTFPSLATPTSPGTLGAPNYVFGVTPQGGAGQMYIAEVQAYGLPS